MPSTNEAAAGSSAKKSSRRRKKKGHYQRQDGGGSNKYEGPSQGGGPQKHNSSKTQMANTSENQTRGFEAMDEKPCYGECHYEADELSLTASKEEAARQFSGCRDKYSEFQGSSALEDWQEKAYAHEQWWNRS